MSVFSCKAYDKLIAMSGKKARANDAINYAQSRMRNARQGMTLRGGVALGSISSRYGSLVIYPPPDSSSLINNISNIKHSNFDLHFLKTENCLSFKLDFDRPWSSKCLPIAECL